MKKQAALLAILISGLTLAQTVRLEGPPRISDANLVGYWRFDEGTGTAVNDFSGNSNNGTFDGTWNRGRYGNAGKFVAASTQEVTIPTSASLNMGTSDFSIVVWARIDAAAASILVSKYGSVGYFLGVDATGKFYGKVRDASTNVSVLGSVISDGKWHLLVMTVDRSDASTGLKLYLDGEYNTQGQQGGASIDNTESFYIGRLSSGYYLTGEIDDVRICKRIISTDEIKRLWSQSTIKVRINGEAITEPVAY
ncbi:MAG TPA: LamG domain-containing protein [bacterium]|nr:LamG domain-containing protein [bacterium]